MERMDSRYPDHVHTSSGEYSSEDERVESIVSKAHRNSLRGVKTDLTPRNMDQIFEGYTLLHIAVSKGHWSIAEYLIAQKADPDIPNCKGKTVRKILKETTGGEGCDGLCADAAHKCQELFKKLGD